VKESHVTATYIVMIIYSSFFFELKKIKDTLKSEGSTALLEYTHSSKPRKQSHIFMQVIRS